MLTIPSSKCQFLSVYLSGMSLFLSRNLMFLIYHKTVTLATWKNRKTAIPGGFYIFWRGNPLTLAVGSLTCFIGDWLVSFLMIQCMLRWNKMPEVLKILKLSCHNASSSRNCVKWKETASARKPFPGERLDYRWQSCVLVLSSIKWCRATLLYRLYSRWKLLSTGISPLA